jgi:hypothetical protein
MMLQVPWTILDSFRGDNFSEDSFRAKDRVVLLEGSL